MDWYRSVYYLPHNIGIPCIYCIYYIAEIVVALKRDVNNESLVKKFNFSKLKN